MFLRLTINLFFLSVSFSALAFQDSNDSIPLINSGEVIDRAVQLHDEEKYEEAIAAYLSIPENDSNYVYMLSELALTYNTTEQYEKAVEVALKGMEKKFTLGSQLAIALGNAYDELGQREKAVQTYQEALLKYPYSHLLHFNLGITYVAMGKDDEALIEFQESVKINPFHAGSHHGLGQIMIRKGNKAKAILSLTFYLALVPSNNAVLVQLENLANDALRYEGISSKMAPDDPFREVEMLLDAKAALDKRFKSSVGFDASIVKSIEMMLEKLPYGAENDFWARLYLPFWKQLKDQGLGEAFVYFILYSTENEKVTAWLEKNKAQKDQMVAQANSQFVSFKKKHQLSLMGEEGSYTFWYYDNGKLSAIGNENANGKYIGPWQFFYVTDQLNAQGKYNSEGKKTGQWEYFHENGVLNKVEVYDQAGFIVEPVTYFAESGAKVNWANFKENELHGELHYFNDSGNLSEIMNYKEGTPDGEGRFYYATGQLYGEYSNKEGEFDGVYKKYFRQGQLLEDFNYEKGKIQGKYTSYYANGAEDETGNFSDGKYNGVWQGYFMNGVKSYEGEYREGKQFGDWKYYHTNGKLKEEDTFDEEGLTQGLVKIYARNGWLLAEKEFRSDTLISYTFYNEKAKCFPRQKTKRVILNTPLIMKMAWLERKVLIREEKETGRLNSIFLLVSSKLKPA